MYICNYCREKCENKTELYSHINNTPECCEKHKVKMGRSGYKCHYCGRQFPNKNKLFGHLKYSEFCKIKKANPDKSDWQIKSELKKKRQETKIYTCYYCGNFKGLLKEVYAHIAETPECKELNTQDRIRREDDW